jgi:hypothetical protein
VKNSWHKFKNWEYWPAYIVFVPSFFLWLMHAIWLRNFRFFKFVNPSFPNNGFHEKSKTEIYKLLPAHLYPKTIFVEAHAAINLSEMLKQYNFQYALIAKPDNGKRGIGVQKINNLEELKQYHSASDLDYLIQEQTTLKNEIGLFYYKHPTSKVATITGLVGKEWMTVIGDGEQTVLQLMKQNPRYALQIKRLQCDNASRLQIIPNLLQHFRIEEIGNHNRGTKFIDESHRITPKLQKTFQDICKKIDGFYYGRFDIRFDNWADLENGKNFIILEINGAASEPAHIYDPKHSIYYGWTEIFKHQQILFSIAKFNQKILFSKK